MIILMIFSIYSIRECRAFFEGFIDQLYRLIKENRETKNGTFANWLHVYGQPTWTQTNDGYWWKQFHAIDLYFL